MYSIKISFVNSKNNNYATRMQQITQFIYRTNQGLLSYVGLDDVHIV